MKTKEKLWTKDFICITSISFFIFFVFYVLLTLLPLYIAETLHAGANQAGLLVTLFLLAAIAIRPFAGHWVSQYSNKTILMISAIMFALVTLLYSYCTSITALLGIRILHGMAFGVITTVKGTISAKMIPLSRRAEGISYFSLAMGLAMVMGPYLGLNLAKNSLYLPAFWICISVSIVNVVLAALMNIPKPVAIATDAAQHEPVTWTAMFDKAALPFALVTFFMTFAYSGIASFLALHARELNLMTAASSFLLCYAAFLMFCRLFTGNICDRRGAKYVIYPCLAFFAIGLAILGLSHGAFMMILAGALVGIGYGSVTPIFQAQIIGSVQPHKIGIANSLFFNAMDGGLALGAFVLGMIADTSGYHAIYQLSAVLVVVAGVLYARQTKKRPALSTQRSPEEAIDVANP